MLLQRLKLGFGDPVTREIAEPVFTKTSRCFHIWKVSNIESSKGTNYKRRGILNRPISGANSFCQIQPSLGGNGCGKALPSLIQFLRHPMAGLRGTGAEGKHCQL